MWMDTALVLAIFCVHFSGINAEEYHNDLNETYPGYGDTWMFFPDGEGNPMVVNLTDPPPEVKGRLSNSDMLVNFHLYTRSNMHSYSELVLEDSSSNEVESGPPFNDNLFDTKKNVKIVTHGWQSSGLSTTCLLMKDAYLRDRDVNVIIVDWQALASNFFYFIPAYNTKIVGQKTGRLIDYLIQQHGMRPEQFHMIGHSLGAHVAGCAGNAVKSGKIGRITGLDPAKPGFENWANPVDRLDPDDAQFVDVVHTCAGVLGYSGPLGHADFYPNGGRPTQPGCLGLTQIMEACSHARAHQFFTESIERPRGFMGSRCRGSNDAMAGSCASRAGYVDDNEPTINGTNGVNTTQEEDGANQINNQTNVQENNNVDQNKAAVIEVNSQSNEVDHDEVHDDDSKENHLAENNTKEDNKNNILFSRNLLQAEEESVEHTNDNSTKCSGDSVLIDEDIEGQDVGRNSTPCLKASGYENEVEDYEDGMNGRDVRWSVAVMGDSAPSDVRGIFYVKTNPNEPYARNLD